MKIYTLGFTHKSARTFFTLLMKNKIELLVDIRLNNSSQLAGFTKSADLEFFLAAIGMIGYLHYPSFAPTKEILNDIKKKKCDWDEYRKRFQKLLKERDCIKDFLGHVQSVKSICMLCSEELPDHCHRSLVADYLRKKIKGSVVRHL